MRFAYETLVKIRDARTAEIQIHDAQDISD